MKNNIVNIIGIFFVAVLTVIFNLFSDLKLTADGILGSNSSIKILSSFLFIFIWLFGSFYIGYKKERRIIGFISLIYGFIFICCLFYNGIFLVFSYIFTPFLPIAELLKIDNELESGNLFYIILCLFAFFAINLVATFLGKSLSGIKEGRIKRYS